MYEYYKHLLTKNNNPKAETIDVNTITLDKSLDTVQIDKFKTKQHNDKDIQIVKSWLKDNAKCLHEGIRKKTGDSTGVSTGLSASEGENKSPVGDDFKTWVKRGRDDGKNCEEKKKKVRSEEARRRRKQQAKERYRNNKLRKKRIVTERHFRLDPGTAVQRWYGEGQPVASRQRQP
ncbi:hypothetical protein ACHWQZ_G017406 [Mnemiopsis leidyi]